MAQARMLDLLQSSASDKNLNLSFKVKF